MNDREILELCAKAMGSPITCKYRKDFGVFFERPGKDYGWFNPIDFDSDYVEMESWLGLDAMWRKEIVIVKKLDDDNEIEISISERYENHNGDKSAAKRRAGCLVAAEIERKKG